ncbi:(2Fe-2S) ferredoxin domain-containing protein [Pelagicoccus sp. SDUM812003]|uniref:(2Fe-2S) ferredoxin domain-containing protein n=1 Tax=Pelagicoccus sp. SDUM812003 TaxID=3041267 RepID=UPI00280E5704|nr:(2Fe-2S) ferredoxin domain-containing protein [Pelagicoccus sp. SDUM812003]MDQ8203646.1 (2Fe-2S) ferredoxin domain-containing protein [Pelagicoccus sp. SDUM812003]
MNKPEHHLFICGSARANGELKGVCCNKESIDLLSYTQSEVQDRMLGGVEVSMTGCLNMCTRGPVVIDYPSGNFYEKVTEELIDEILDAIEEGEVCQTNLIKD